MPPGISTNKHNEKVLKQIEPCPIWQFPSILFVFATFYKRSIFGTLQMSFARPASAAAAAQNGFLLIRLL